MHANNHVVMQQCGNDTKFETLNFGKNIFFSLEIFSNSIQTKS
jgi:hypothetical protein